MPLSRQERAPLVTDAIPPPLRRGGAGTRQVLGVCLIGAVVLALFASRDTPGWAERRGDTPFDHEVREIAGTWDAAMQTLGLIQPHEALRAAIGRMLEWRWAPDSR
jgi:hypothetical protein